MIAAIYPGQGSQQPGMGQYLFNEFKVARETFEEASDAIGVDLKKLCFTGSEADLGLTENTQPALLTVSTATYRVVAALAPLNPVAAAGHSIGEYAAVVNSKAMDFSDAVRAVRLRGQAMQEAVPVGVGAMAAVLGLSDDQVKAICAWVREKNSAITVEAANFNSPGQVVISGHKAAIDWLSQHFSENDIPGMPSRLKLIPLKVSAPFHSSLMKPAEEKMRIFLQSCSFQDAEHSVVQNVSALAVKTGSELRENLVKQISAPVRWTECMGQLKSLGVRNVIEMGAGKVLAGLAKKMDPEHWVVFNLNSLEDIKSLEQTLTKQGQNESIGPT